MARHGSGMCLSRVQAGLPTSMDSVLQKDTLDLRVTIMDFQVEEVIG